LPAPSNRRNGDIFVVAELAQLWEKQFEIEAANGAILHMRGNPFGIAYRVRGVDSGARQ
jgi:hypothetical protein